MTTHYRTQGFVLKKEDLRETDQLFTVYTKDFGKLKILGRAVRKIGAKLRGSFQLFRLVELEFIQGKSHKTLTDAVVIKEFYHIENDLKKMKAVHQMADVLDGLVTREEKEEKIWLLLEETFERINSLRFSFVNLRLLYYYFFWNLVSVLGYQPQLSNCTSCHQKLKHEGLSFAPEEGGVICVDCFEKNKTKESVWISAETIKILRLILRKNWPTLKRLKVEKDILINLKEVSDVFLKFLLSQNSVLQYSVLQ